jgi:hypothetical protein
VLPLTPLTEQVGVCVPHCEPFVAVGAEGSGLTVTLTEAVVVHPVEAVPTTV